MFNTGKLDIFISVLDIGSQPRIKSFYYRSNLISGLRPEYHWQAENFTLYQNYPNPFNLSTIIAFQLPRSRVVTLSIYDITGKEVKTLVNNQQYAPGEHEIKWDGLTDTGKEVSSGIYLYELTTSRFRQAKKMLYVK
jgi:hypothetical protein